MKKTLLIVLAAAAIRVPVFAQGPGPVAERYHSFVDTKQIGWDTKTNYSTINKTIMKKTIFMATLISAAMTVNAQTNSKDEQAIRDIVTSMQKGWNAKDGKTFASGFAAVHNYIVINGMYLSAINPEINANSHQGIFNSIYKTTDLELKIDKITFVSPGLALVYVLGATYQKGAALPENPGAMISMVVEKKNDDWKIISFHNCPIQVSFKPGDEAQNPVPPKVMYASWYKQ
jgi:uncharacterized protein (TIGR02246 family)